ncbi:MAG: hypothetical protein CVU89_05030 [Firmicutes bacterium HGW-Firmicutes-14]|nr:MAG: hypothetical protein CVU89_05030 [Firmicutes bacterium HGW-Firmicutes-14]
MQIPLVDLKIQYRLLKEEIDESIEQVLTTANFIKGQQVKEFERLFADFCSADYCIAVSNGTDAIYLALKTLGVGLGDEVITVPNTFIATTEAISMAGADVVFCDIDRNTYTINAETLEEFITPNTKALIPVHLYGCPCDMDQVLKIAKQHGLHVVGDAAQAHGAEYKGKDVSFYTDVSTYSFFPGKNLGAYGDGGAVLTNNAELGQKIRLLADHGRTEKYEHIIEGTNSRLDTIQAAVLNVKIKYLDSWNNARRNIAATYNKLFQDFGHAKPQHIPDGYESVYHLYVLEVEKRDELLSYLREQGISAGIHYPISLPFQKAYHHLNCRQRFQYVQDIADRLISLPIFPEMTEEQVKYVIQKVKEFYK